MLRPPRIHCLHTAVVHEPTFTHLIRTAAPEASLVHSVRCDWLAHARAHGLDAALARDVQQVLARVAAEADAVLVTCSTLGPLADASARTLPHIVRIDTPLMRTAATFDGHVLLVMCLDSTRAATEALFEAACADAGKTPRYRVLVCADAWPHFERGDSDGFARAIADAVERSITTADAPAAIVLAQASMTVAEPALVGLGIPVLSSPALAVAEALRVAALRKGARA